MAEEFVALLGAVASEVLPLTHFVHGLVHGLANGDGEGFRHITDTTTDEPRRAVRVRVGERLHASVDFGKEVACFELEVIRIEMRHGRARDLIKDSYLLPIAHHLKCKNPLTVDAASDNASWKLRLG